VSYILDALRKAERDHHVSRVPTLATAHGGVDRRRPSWIWPVATMMLAIGAVVALAFQWASVRSVHRDPVAAGIPPAPASPVVASRPDPGPSAPPVERAPARVEPSPADVVVPPSEHPPAARAPAGHAIAPPASASRPPPAAKVGPDRRLRAEKASASPAPASRSTAAVAVPPASSPSIDRDPAREPRPSAEAVASPAVTSAPPSDVGRAAPTAPAQALPRLTLDVLVYSDVPAERLVFINGRKYVEGQAVDGVAVVEQITPDGAILRHEGKQIVLRPKLNPYARPGSP
jgi:hypothetical protein